jgi:hypothetical protein
MKKLIPKSRLRGVAKTSGDSVKDRQKRLGMKDKNLELLERSERAWMNLQSLRRERRRNIQYVFGDQWGDFLFDGRKMVTERQRIIAQTGNPPLQNNHLIKIERTLSGLYAKTSTAPVCFARNEAADVKSDMMTKALQTNWENNSMKELLTSEMSECITGGLPVLSVEWGVQHSLEDAYAYIVNPDYFFYESKSNDPRMWDVSMVGEIRDYYFDELCAEFAESDYDIQQLKYLYEPFMNNNMDYVDQQDHYRYESWNTPPASKLCRTYRIWTIESKPRYRCWDVMDEEQPVYRIEVEDLQIIKDTNQARVQMFIDDYVQQGMDLESATALALEEAPLIEYERINDVYWFCQILTPDGYILDEYESPYEHKEHPYCFRPYQLVNGRIVPYISTAIDQQRYINRLITLKDMYVHSMVKGLKIVPKTLLGDMSPKEFARQAVEMNGWIFFEPDERFPNQAPQIVSQHAADLGVEEMIQLQVSWLSDITSVSDSLQGKSPTSGTAASRYRMETENSTTAIASLLHKFSCFERDVARKLMKVIHQYYTEKRNLSTQHSNGYADYAVYEPVEVQDIDFDVAIKESAESPVSRMMINDLVQQMWMSGALNAEQMLQFSYVPGAAQLLQSLRAAREAAAQQGIQDPSLSQTGVAMQQTAGQTPAMQDMNQQLSKFAQGADPIAVQNAQQALRG